MIGLTDNPEQREIRSNGPPLIIYQQTKLNESKNYIYLLQVYYLSLL